MLTIEHVVELYSERFPDSSEKFPVYNPSTLHLRRLNSPLAALPNLGSKETQQAIQTSELAYNDWKSSTVQQRARILEDLANTLEEHLISVAKIIHLENGKSLGEAASEVQYSIGFFRWFSTAIQSLRGSITPATKNLHIQTIYQPIGVCAAITPWNFPLAMLAKKCAAAIAAGCTIICKPSEETPISALTLMLLAEKSGLPKNVLTVVTTTKPNSVGETLCKSKVVRKLSFTGSTSVGKLLLAQSAHSLQKCSLELGGNAPFIVLESANLDTVIQGVLKSKFRNSGQACISANRFIIAEAIYDEFIERLVPVVKQLRLNEETKEGGIGPLINPRAVNKAHNLVQNALHHGATVVLGELDIDIDQCWMNPIILSNINPDMDLWWDELFAPIIACCRAHSSEEAIRLANLTNHGLGAYLFTTKVDEIHSLPASLHAGMVGVNTGSISLPQTPFGGVKSSGFGREGGTDGLLEYLTTQTIFTQFST